MSDTLSPRSLLVQDALRQSGISGEIVVLPDAASTAALAAAALGVEVLSLIHISEPTRPY